MDSDWLRKIWFNITRLIIKLMSEILNAKCNQVPVFVEILKKHNKAVVFAETTSDDFWATGLDKDATIHIVATAWPGDNKLGAS